MRKMKPCRAALDQVRITREGHSALIEHADTSVSTTSLTIGPGIEQMSDHDILALYNGVIASQEQLLRKWDSMVTEIPVGKPQIKRDRYGHLLPRGEVLRCVIEDDANGETVICIDDKELSLHEFGRLLGIYAGWGMRIAFVPEELVHENPKVAVREPPRRKSRRR